MTGPGNTNGEAEPIARVDESQKVDRVRIKVNGITLDVARTVGVREVLEAAKGTGAIVGNVDEYVIERVTVEGEIGPEATITVTELEEFMAVPIGKTEAA
jgi:hypothetical protein